MFLMVLNRTRIKTVKTRSSSSSVNEKRNYSRKYIVIVCTVFDIFNLIIIIFYNPVMVLYTGNRKTLNYKSFHVLTFKCNSTTVNGALVTDLSTYIIYI